jgi:threonine efflux protein
MSYRHVIPVKLSCFTREDGPSCQESDLCRPRIYLLCGHIVRRATMVRGFLESQMLSTLLTISLLNWVVLLTPGPNVLLVSSLGANGSRTAACLAGIGITVVAGIWATLAVMGVHVIFQAHPSLKLVLQLCGGAYLIYLAHRLWRSAGALAAANNRPLSPAAAFGLGFLTNITNPKSALFFGSVFTTALPVDASMGLLAASVCLVVVNALVWHLFLAFAFSQSRIQSAYARHVSWLNRAAGALIGAFGLTLIVGTVREALKR